LVEAAIQEGLTDAIIQGPNDAEAVEECIKVGVGGTVSVDIGGKLDYINGAPLAVRGRVERILHVPVEYEVDDLTLTLTLTLIA